MPSEVKHILRHTIDTKLEQNQPLFESEVAYVLRPPRGVHKDYALSETKHGLLNANQVSDLDSMSGLKYPVTAILTVFRTEPEFSAHHVQVYYPYW